jgi:hypothetical protein
MSRLLHSRWVHVVAIFISLFAGAFSTAANAQTPYCWLSCSQASISGLYIGGELVKNWGAVQTTERSAVTNTVTNIYSDRADPFGGGVLVGVKTAPLGGFWVISPFASFDFIRSPVNHNFPGGSYLGTTATFIGTGGIKTGPQFDNGVWLYGIAGGSVMNETLNVNFVPTLSALPVTVTGGTLGGGAAFQPIFLQGFARQVSVFLEYQHTWWWDAHFQTPAANPGSNYTFRRQDDIVKLGFTVSLYAPPSAPAMITKAPSK